MKDLKKYAWLILGVFIFFMFYKPIVCMLLIGSLVLFYSVHYYIFLKNIKQNGIEELGEILRYVRDSEGYKTPIVKFETKKGIKVETEPYYYASTDLSKFKKYKKNINKSVTVLYEPEKPEKFILKSENSFNTISLIIMALAGSLFFILAIANLLGYIKFEN